jgi:hypothetical protein
MAVLALGIDAEAVWSRSSLEAMGASLCGVGS